MQDRNILQAGEIVIYESSDGLIKIDVTLRDDTVWVSLNQMTQIFDRDKSVISRHLKNVFTEGELEESATVANFATVQAEGARTIKRMIEY